jgi:steroid delta-isomerase-like uncharacterized protein
LSIKENKALMRRWFEMEDFKGVPKSEIEQTMRKVSQDMYAPEFVVHEPEVDMPLEAYMKYSIARLNAFPDWNCTIEDMVAEGDRVVARMTIRGTHRGEFRGIPATGKKIKLGTVAIARFSGGKFVEGWGYYDRLDLMQQLGAIPKK